MKYTIVTSFNMQLWAAYAHKTIPSWAPALPEGTEIIIYTDTTQEKEQFEKDNAEKFPNITWRSLEDVRACRKFLTRWGKGQAYEEFYSIDFNALPDGQKWRYNYIPFAKKVYAWVDAYRRIDSDYMIWLDADVAFKKPMTEVDLDDIIEDNHLAWLDREHPFKHPETGFFALKNSGLVGDYVEEVVNTYNTGALFYLFEWHDCFAMKEAWVKQSKLEDAIDTKNINPTPFSKNLDVFGGTELDEFLIHFKGGNKAQLNPQAQAQQQQQDGPGDLYIDPNDPLQPKKKDKPETSKTDD